MIRIYPLPTNKVPRTTKVAGRERAQMYRLGANLSTVREQNPSQPHCSSLPFVILACAKGVSRF